MKVAFQSRARALRVRAVKMRSSSEGDERIVRYLKLSGAWEDAEAQLKLDDVLRGAARRDGVNVEDEVLQEGVDLFREDLGLGTVDATQKWLAQTGLTLEDVEDEVEARIVAGALCDRLSRREVEDAFQANRIRFDSVLLRIFVIDNPVSARALATQLREARDADHGHAVLERCVGRRMEWGWFHREELPERAATQIFKAMPGVLLGPMEIREGRHAVYGVEAFRQAVLDSDVEQQICRELVAERARIIMNPDDPGAFVLK